MEYRKIGNSGLKVSEFGLGGNNFGVRTDEPTALGIIHRALEKGINFIDTSDGYAQGHSEEVIGKAVKGKRSKVIIATKFGSDRPDRQSGSRVNIMESVEGSLKRLNTDYIDLYYIHQPDPKTPIYETLRALDDLIKSGKVRYIGCSNYAAWQICEAIWASKLHNLNCFVAAENRYNMVEREIEQELVPCCLSYEVGVIPYAPIAGGFLTGKYRRGEQLPEGSRMTWSRFKDNILTDTNFDKLDKLEIFAKERGHSVGELAIVWQLSHPWIGSVIAGAMNSSQLDANLAAADWKLTADDLVNLSELLDGKKASQIPKKEKQNKNISV